jgi:hypothetical protein
MARSKGQKGLKGGKNATEKCRTMYILCYESSLAVMSIGELACRKTAKTILAFLMLVIVVGLELDELL